MSIEGSVTTKILSERISGHTIQLYDYKKHDGGSKNQKTGTALLINEIDELAVVDIDINKEKDDETKEVIRDTLLKKLHEEDVVVKTCSGGLHVYCNMGEFVTPKDTNRSIKYYTSEFYDVDVFTSDSKYRDKRSLLVGAESRYKANAKSPVTRYTFVRGGYDKCVTRNISDVLQDLGIPILPAVTVQPIIPTNTASDGVYEPYYDDVKTNNMDTTNTNTNDVAYTREIMVAIVNGLSDIHVHNDGACRSIIKEVTLYTLFQAINALPEEYIETAYNNIRTKCELTEKATSSFDTARERYRSKKTKYQVLIKMLKAHRPDYYKEHIAPLLYQLRRGVVVRQEIDLNDTFSMVDIVEKANDKKYQTYGDVVSDLLKVIRYIDGEQKMFVEKVLNAKSGMWKLSYTSDATMTKSLRMIRLWKEENRIVTAYDAFIDNREKFTVLDVLFNNTVPNPRILSVFHGYKYHILDDVDIDTISTFLNYVEEVICDSNKVVYDYVINWVATMLQNPGIKNETALVLKGLEGIGKNRFTDVLSELLAGYSEENITKMEEITGDYNAVVENKMLIVLNELKNCGGERMANFDALKSVITDKTMRYGEKYIPSHTGENVANFIFCTNNAYPVKIGIADRRYVVLRVNGKYRGNYAFFNTLCGSFTPTFYDNLLTFFIKRDLTEFNVRAVPMTEAKQDLIQVSKNVIDEWINDNYDVLLEEGISWEDALCDKPYGMKDDTYILQIKERCDKRRVTRGGKQVYRYILKHECQGLYHQTHKHDDECNDADDTNHTNNDYITM